MNDKRRHGNRYLELIAAFRFMKAVLLVLVGIASLQLLRPALAARLRDWFSEVSFASEHQVVHSALAKIFALSPHGIELVAAVAFGYAALFFTEAVGLWKEKVWAEYLTIVATASLIPLEVYEVVKRVTFFRVGAVIANVAIVVYLIYLRVHAHRLGLQTA